MKRHLLIFCLAWLVQPAFCQDYNKLDKQYQDIAVLGLSKLSDATRDWFITTAQKHPVGNFDATWSKTQLNSKFTPSQVTDMEELFVVMMSYLKQVNKEAREDRKLKIASSTEVNNYIKNKIKSDNKSIETEMQEAREKADIAQANANNSQGSGVTSGNVSAASGAQQKTDADRPNTANQKRQKTYSDSLKNNNTESVAKKINQQTSSIKTQSSDQQKTSLDNLRKMLDKLGRIHSNL